MSIASGSIIEGCQNIDIGNNVYIGPGAIIYSTKAKLTIGDYFMAGPRLSIVTGDHRTDAIGENMMEVKEKKENNDMNVVIEKDVWCGINVTILKGVTIGKGSIIAAGAIVMKSIPPYSVYLSRDKIIPRFTQEQIHQHEAMIEKKEHVVNV